MCSGRKLLNYYLLIGRFRAQLLYFLAQRGSGIRTGADLLRRAASCWWTSTNPADFSPTNAAPILGIYNRGFPAGCVAS